MGGSDRRSSSSSSRSGSSRRTRSSSRDYKADYEKLKEEHDKLKKEKEKLKKDLEKEKKNRKEESGKHKKAIEEYEKAASGYTETIADMQKQMGEVRTEKKCNECQGNQVKLKQAEEDLDMHRRRLAVMRAGLKTPELKAKQLEEQLQATFKEIRLQAKDNEHKKRMLKEAETMYTKLHEDYKELETEQTSAPKRKYIASTIQNICKETLIQR